MRTKQLLRKCSYSLLLVLFTLICALTFIVKPTKAVAEEETTAEENVTWLMTPTDENDYDTDNDFTADQYTVGIEEDASAPSGKVIYHTYDNRTIATGSGLWPTFTVKATCENAADVTDFAGWIMWIEFNGEMSSAEEGASDYAAFNFTNTGDAILNSQYITFVDENGKISQEKPRWELFHCKYTDNSNAEYTYSYKYSFKGYMIMPKENFNGGATLETLNTFNFTHDSTRVGYMNIKVGDIGYYTDYDAVVNEYGRCNYSFVDADGTVIETKSVQPGSTVVAPEYKNTFTQDGKVYEFVGWSNYTAGMKITSDKIFNASYKVRDFHTIEGASVRTNTGSSGIRFTAEFDENVYNEVSLDENLEFGMIITKYEYYKEAMEQSDDLMTGLKALQGTKYVLITESTQNPLRPVKHVEEGKEFYRINGALTNIKYSHMDWKWVGVGVIIKTTDNGTEYIYSAHDVEEGTRTLSYVASAALNDPKENFNQTQTDTLKNYVYTMAAKLSGVSEAEYKAATDKSAYLNDYKLEISGGIKADYDFNANDGTKEAYLNLNESKELFAAVKNESGATLDVAYSISVGDSSVLDVDGTTVTAIKNGYSSLTTSCAIFGINDTITVYTGSTVAGNMNVNMNKQNEATHYDWYATGEKEGVPYYGAIWRMNAKADYAGGTFWMASYTKTMSAYYIDYLISQGYKYVRIPFYADTSLEQDIYDTGVEYVKAGDTIKARTSISKEIAGTARLKDYEVPTNQWVYYDMDIYLYRANMTQADTVIDEYGIKTSAGSAYTYPILIFPTLKNCYIYFGQQTFVTSSTLEVEENSNSVYLGETVKLNEWYETNAAAKFTVDGVEMEEMNAIKATHTIGISANIYTANIGDGTYTIGNSASWTIHGFTAAPSVEKTLSVEGGIDISSNAEILVDTKEAETAGKAILLGDYTGASELEKLGFNVTHTYVKRYSDQTVNTATEIANTERGIFYVTVSAENNAGQTLSYQTTLDLYNSSEPIEYESFGHDDSDYAVRAYYAIQDSKSEGLYDNFKSYDYTSNYYVTGTKNSGDQNLYGMELSFNTYFKKYKYGDTAKDTTSNGPSRLKYVYGCTDEKLKDVTYLGFDGSQISLNDPINGGWEAYTIDSCIYIYVLPRHTQTYYAEFAKDNADVILKTAYAEPWGGYSGSETVVANFLTGVSGDISAPTCSKTKKQNASGDWQQSLISANNQTINVQTIATYYDSFESMSFPFVAWSRPGGRSANYTSNGQLKLGMLIF